MIPLTHITLYDDPTDLFPSVEVHTGQLAKIDISHVYIEGLALVDIGTSVGSHVNKHSLRDLPHCPVKLLQVIRNLFKFLHKGQGNEIRARCVSLVLATTV